MPDTSTEVGDTKGVSIGEECDSPSKWITPICPFEPGEEEEARRFLEQPGTVSDLKISSREMRTSVPELVAAIGGVLTLVCYPFVGLYKRGEWPPLDDVVGATCLIVLPLWAFFRLVMQSQGAFIVSSSTAKIVLGGEELATFDELGVPRRARKILTREDHRGKELKDEWPVIVMSRSSGEDLVVFRDSVTVSSKVLNRMDEIADHINALLAEHHQRKAVERWLAEREAEQDQQRIYR